MDSILTSVFPVGHYSGLLNSLGFEAASFSGVSIASECGRMKRGIDDVGG